MKVSKRLRIFNKSEAYTKNNKTRFYNQSKKKTDCISQMCILWARCNNAMLTKYWFLYLAIFYWIDFFVCMHFKSAFNPNERCWLFEMCWSVLAHLLFNAQMDSNQFEWLWTSIQGGLNVSVGILKIEIDFSVLVKKHIYLFYFWYSQEIKIKNLRRLPRYLAQSAINIYITKTSKCNQYIQRHITKTN